MLISALLAAQTATDLLPSAGAGAVAALIITGVIKAFSRTPQSIVDHYLAQRLAAFGTTLDRVDQARNESYRKIWTLTAAFNLFGSPTQTDLSTLQSEFRDWYFAHGQVMSQEAKDWYFHMMEVLGALEQSPLEPQRPDNKKLYGSHDQTLSVLKAELKRVRDALGVSDKLPPLNNLTRRIDSGYQKSAAQPRLDVLILELKVALMDKPDDENTAVLGWLVAQELMSRLRTVLIRDLGTQKLFT